MKTRIASFMLALALLSGASVASAQTTTAQNPWAYMPMAYFWGNQATTATNTLSSTTQVTSTNTNSALENFWSLMPMFRFFNYPR